MHPDSLTNRQFVNLLTLKEKCEEHERERAVQAERNLKEDGSSFLYFSALLLGVSLLFIAAFRF